MIRLLQVVARARLVSNTATCPLDVSFFVNRVRMHSLGNTYKIMNDVEIVVDDVDIAVTFDHALARACEVLLVNKVLIAVHFFRTR